MKNDVKGLEMHPHGVGKIRNTSVRESVSRQQKTKFVIDVRQRRRQPREQRQPQRKCREAARENSQPRASGEVAQASLHPAEPTMAELRAHQCQQQRNRYKQRFKPKMREHNEPNPKFLTRSTAIP
jgi:hypothetical protein